MQLYAFVLVKLFVIATQIKENYAILVHNEILLYNNYYILLLYMEKIAWVTAYNNIDTH